MKGDAKINFWRILEPILLGSFGNIIINIVFNPGNPSGWWSKTEFVVAIIFCVPITEINRLVEKKLEDRYGKDRSYKLFFYQLLILSFSILIILNVLGRAYHWLMYDDFYEWGEILVINLIVFMLSSFLVTFRWAYKFYRRLKVTESNLDESQHEIEKLASKVNHSDQIIILTKLQGDFSVKAQNIRIAIIEYGSVKVFDMENIFYGYQGTLTELSTLLPDSLFFQVTRNVIVHRKTIQSIASLPYGKIQLKIHDFGSKITEATVSRPKASSFRKWYHIT